MRNLSCPAVSQTVSLRRLPWRSRNLRRKSTPEVGCVVVVLRSRLGFFLFSTSPARLPSKSSSLLACFVLPSRLGHSLSESSDHTVVEILTASILSHRERCGPKHQETLTEQGKCRRQPNEQSESSSSQLSARSPRRTRWT